MFSLLPLKASSAVVSEVEVTGLSSIRRDELLYLLGVRPGEHIDKESIQYGIKRTFLKGIFEDIAIETEGEDNAKVIITVRERDIIQNIYIEGNFPLSNKTVRMAFPVKEGEVIACDVLESAVAHLKSEMKGRGFPHSTVNVQTEKSEELNRINIHLYIQAGEPELISKINILGTDDKIKAVMRVSEGDRYDYTDIAKDLERIKRYYKKKGYFNPIIGPHTFTHGILDIPINPGKRLEILIEGNEIVSQKVLLKVLPFFEAEDFNDDIVEEAVHKMLSIYHAEGYPFAQIAPFISSQDELINLTFFIFEGQRVEVSDISFIGNSLSENKLKEILSLQEGKLYNPDLIDDDRETLIHFYYAIGYLSVDIEEFQTNVTEDDHTVKIIIRINEGLRTEIDDITIIGTHHIPDSEIRKVIKIKTGDPYNDVDISDARYMIIELYNSRGFPHVKVSIKRKLEQLKASITFEIDEGRAVLLGKTIVAGNMKTDYEVVRRELKQREGTPFNYRMLMKDRTALYKLGLFADVDMEALDSYDSKKDVLLTVREGNAGAIEFSVGYAEYEKFRGVLDLSYRNLWGMNRQSSLRFELSSLEKRSILQYYEPWLLGNPIPFRAFIIAEDRKEISIDTRETRYRLTRYAISAGIEKKISEVLRPELYYEFSLVNTFDVKPDVVLSREDTGTLVISGIRLGLIYDTRNNPFYPTRGVLSGMSVKLTSPVFLSESNFIKGQLFGNLYQRIIKKVVLAFSLRGGIAQGYHETDELPIVERFFLGGRTTVRGYEQDTLGPKGSDGNPTGGNVFLMKSFEIRTSLMKNFGIVAFLDAGNVWVKIQDVDVMDIKYTTGLGLRYNTPVGPLRIDYGHKLQREKGESRGEIHFSIGHAF